MKQGRNIQEVMKEIAKLEGTKRDFIMKLKETAQAVFSEALFGQIVSNMRESTHRKIAASKVNDVVELTQKNFGLTQDEGTGILFHLIAGGDLSQYGLSNAVTRHSQDLESYERATELEGIGRDIINMPAKDWKALNAE